MGEREYVVPSLTEEDAVALFSERAFTDVPLGSASFVLYVPPRDLGLFERPSASSDGR
jgi:hypothetical protein